MSVTSKVKKAVERPRQYVTLRACKGEEFKECFGCKETKDVLCFNTYLYQPKKEGKIIGPKERKRLSYCKVCSLKRKAEKEEKKGCATSMSTASSEA